MKNKLIRQITTTAMLTAVAVILGYFAFPIFPPVAFLEYDLCDVMVLIASFIFGPIYGACSSFIVAFFQAVLLDKSGIFGFIMNIVSTLSFVVPAALFYAKRRTKKGAVTSLLLGVVTMNITMIAFNLVVTPFFMHTTVSVVLKLLPFIIGFNVIKSVVNSVITYLLYKHIGKIIKKFN